MQLELKDSSYYWLRNIPAHLTEPLASPRLLPSQLRCGCTASPSYGSLLSSEEISSPERGDASYEKILKDSSLFLILHDIFKSASGRGQWLNHLTMGPKLKLAENVTLHPNSVGKRAPVTGTASFSSIHVYFTYLQMLQTFLHLKFSVLHAILLIFFYQVYWQCKLASLLFCFPFPSLVQNTIQL